MNNYVISGILFTLAIILSIVYWFVPSFLKSPTVIIEVIIALFGYYFLLK